VPPPPKLVTGKRTAVTISVQGRGGQRDAIQTSGSYGRMVGNQAKDEDEIMLISSGGRWCVPRWRNFAAAPQYAGRATDPHRR
jgi:hypothetical protein